MIQSWILRLPWTDIQEAAIVNQIPTKLIAAIVQTESGGNTNAVRFEPNWKYLLKPKMFADDLMITEQTERVMQSCSFGLMQTMGSVARELGFNDELHKLCEPEIGLKYGCLKLKALAKRYDKREDIIAAFNAGSAIKNIDGSYRNADYVIKVLNYFAQLEG